jgi:hypothetical protein
MALYITIMICCFFREASAHTFTVRLCILQILSTLFLHEFLCIDLIAIDLIRIDDANFEIGTGPIVCILHIIAYT